MVVVVVVVVRDWYQRQVGCSALRVRGHECVQRRTVGDFVAIHILFQRGVSAP